MSRELKRAIEDAHRVVIFTGAGISTESGIPDFRSPGGLWTKMAPIDFQDYLRDADIRAEAWRRKFEIDKTIVKAEPNKGHMAIAKLVDEGKASHVITQNIDNLHQLSGVPAEKVIELHGNGTYAKCLDCATRYELDWVRAQYEASLAAPDCPSCGGIVKSATISFGQAMPEEEMNRAHEATLGCDLFISIGSSLQVYPAAGFPILAKRNGAILAILNREPTELDQIADLVIHDEIGPTLAPIAMLN
ncbi:Sir2 family NAD-dependent protein deacetylase [Parvibaculum sp.]|jgi:NAD-dependent deacetylase|uniref:SIR2 family NAD-dependent protein deacylase n=1 Tax=Parvibaculum sp. TaxID=2024848 RepID=UPI001B272927|nr:Sir2 family NAD-dependent protein deacetylase [Parvibaculum sp.]MBO6634295.1 Sir2 family NAD-dependent protein deacetylase [Parvibaculum sp.]MBO6680273.1 Sir2 family NAD-dependent protein deacetylase [Parvibaculum sp.]MBO6685905.1 Sir2 family NAD-dependent protein deacetylase [Parvibaculum sp.]